MKKHERTKSGKSASSWLVLGATIAFLPALLAAEQTLAIRRNVDAGGPDVLLKDLVQTPAALPDGWADRTVVKSPAPGKPYQYSLASIAYALQQYPDMQDVVLRGDVRLTVKREGEMLDIAEIKKAVEAYVHSHQPWKDSNVLIEFNNLPETILVPKGKTEIQVLSSRETGRGYHAFTASIRVDGVAEQELPVQALVQPLYEVWVAALPLDRGHSLSVSDLQVKLQPLEYKGVPHIPATESIEGLELDRTLRAGQPISKQYLLQPRCAARGDQINVTAQKNRLQISLRAKALGEGRLGDRIFCMNEQSQRRLLVQLVGSKQAMLVDF